MDLTENLQNNAKKLNKDILLGKPSDCKYCQGASVSIWMHYVCTNRKCKQYGEQSPLCSKDCEEYEKKE